MAAIRIAETVEVARRPHSGQEVVGSILIVHEQAEACQSLIATLSEQGHRVDVVTSKEEAALVARLIQPDVIVVDLSRSRSHGLAVLEELRAADPSVGIVAITDEPRYAMAALVAGAVDVVPSCLPRTALESAIRSALAVGANVARKRVPIPFRD